MAILALGVGLGMSTTMFAILDAIVHPYVPYQESYRIYGIRFYLPTRPVIASDADVYQNLRDVTRSFSGWAAMSSEVLPLEAGDNSRQVNVASVSPSYFGVVQVEPVLGRVFNEGDGENVVVISQGLWRKLFGLRLRTNGAIVRLGSRSYQVVGVLPRGATHPNGTEAWIPLPADRLASAHFSAVARLRPGVTEQRASDELRVLAGVLTERYRVGRGAPIGLVLRGFTIRFATLRDIHTAMVGAALLVLLIACTNLANLTLARGLARQRELALRMALGASQHRVIGQMFVECAIITVAGSLLGGLLAIWGTDVLTNQLPSEISWVGLMEPRLSWRVFGWSALAAGMASILFGLWPAVRVASRVDMAEPLKDGSTTTGRVKQRYSPLVIAEVALALVLLMGGGLLLRTVRGLLREGDFGFDTRTLWRADIHTVFRFEKRPVATSEEMLAAARGVPGVIDAAMEGSNITMGASLSSEVSSDWPLGRVFATTYPVVTPSYLRTLGVAVRRGRDFEEGDVSVGMSAIVDPVAAAKLYPGRDPLGRMVKLGSASSNAGWVPIIGVASNPRRLDPHDDALKPYVWVVAPPNAIRGALVFRTSSRDPRAVVDVRQRLSEQRGVHSVDVVSYTHERDAELASREFLAGVFVTMGAVALGLSGLGLYGVLSYAVSQRMREFAVRVALGAQAVRLYRMVLHDAAVMLLGGIGIGALVAFGAMAFLKSALVGVYRTDALSLVVAELLLLSIGLAAAFVPARRAVRADPLQIMRAI